MTNSVLKVPISAIWVAVLAVVIFLLLGAPVDTIREIVIEDGVAYLAVGHQGIQIVDVTNPSNPKQLGSFNSIGEANGLTLQKGRETENGPRDYLYVADGSNGLIVLDVTDPNDISQIWRFDKASQANDVLLQGNFAYVADGKDGLYALKIHAMPPEKTDEENPFYLQVEKDVEGEVGLRQLALGDKQVFGIRGEVDFVIYDISSPWDTEPGRAVKSPARINDMATQYGIVYFALEGYNLGWIKNPSAATEKMDNDPQPLAAEELGFSYQTLDVYGIYAYLGRLNKGIEMVDISDLDAVHTVSQEKQKDNEDADLVREPTTITYEKQYIFVGDGRKGLNSARISANLEVKQVDQEAGGTGLAGSVEDVKVFFVENDKGEEEEFIYLASCQQGLQIIKPGKKEEKYFIADDLGCAVSIDRSGDFLYVAYRDKGIRKYSISESYATPTPLDVFSTDGATIDVAVRERYAFVANGEPGLLILDLEAIMADQQRVANIGFGEGSNAQGVFILGDYAYVAAGDKGLQIVHIADINHPETVGDYNISTNASAVFVIKPEEQDRIFAYLAGGKEEVPSGVWVIDVTDPQKPKEISRIPTTSPVLDVAVDGAQLYFLEEGRGLQVYNVKNPESPQVRSLNARTGEYSHLTVAKHLVYVGKKHEGLDVYDLDNPENPELLVGYSGGGILKDAVVADRFLYSVDGSDGLWVINIENPKKLSFVDFYVSLGEASAVAFNNDRVFIADGSKGFRIVKLVENKIVDVGKFEEMDNVKAIAADGHYAYVANSTNLVNVFDFENPDEIKDKNAFHARAPVIDMGILGNFLFLAEGGHGIQVLNIKDRPNPIEDNFVTDVPIYNARSIEISPTLQYLYVADGEEGLKIFDIAEPSNSKLVAAFDTPGSAAHVSLMEDYIFVSDEGGGGRIYYSYSRTDFYEEDDENMADGFLEGEIHHMYGVDTSPKQSLDFFILIAKAQEGLIANRAEKTIKLVQEGWYETPGRASMPEMLGRNQVPKRTLSGVLAFVAAGFGYFIATGAFLALFANVIFPVRMRGFNSEAFRRLVYYLLGHHGPVVFAIDGERQQRNSPEFREVGPGVVIADACSAVAIERRAYMPGALSRFLRFLTTRHPRENLTMRTMAPGVEFIRTGERVHSVVDLHRQIRLRPGVKAHTRDGIEISCVVFALFTVSEAPDVYQVAYDGPALPENLRVIRLGTRPPDSGKGEVYTVQTVRILEDILDIEDRYEIHNHVTQNRAPNGNHEPPPRIRRRTPWRPFTYDSRRVFSAAVVGRPYDILEDKQKDWTEVPIHMAVNTFRELLSQELYDNLFHPDQPDGYRIGDLRNQLRARLVNQGILAYEFVERKDQTPIAVGSVWHEPEINKWPQRELVHRKPLRARGIKVIAVGFTELTPTVPTVRDKYMFDYWSANWESQAMMIYSEHELQASRLINQARAVAQNDMVFTLSRILQADDYTREALAIRIFQALESVAADPATQRLLPGETIYLMQSVRGLLLPGSDSGGPPIIPPVSS